MSYFKTYTSILEEKLSSVDRNNLPDEDFGIPSLRKYPMPDKTHTLLAIKFFNRCPKGYEKELAENIKRKMKEYNISEDSIGKNNKLRLYL